MKTTDRKKKKIGGLLVVLSMAYGGTVAVLGATGSGALTIVAMVGAVVLGMAWVAFGMVGSDDD